MFYRFNVYLILTMLYGDRTATMWTLKHDEWIVWSRSVCTNNFNRSILDWRQHAHDFKKKFDAFKEY